MSNNLNLRNAYKAKYDEFYTQYSDIEKEMESYVIFNHNIFRGKTVLCPCDDYEWSNFTKYFVDNFKRLGLKKLVSTCIAKVPTPKPLSLFGADMERCKEEDRHGKIFIKDASSETKGYLDGNGDFRSEEVTKLRDASDIIVTNPPFSLFGPFITWIVGGRGGWKALLYSWEY